MFRRDFVAHIVGAVVAWVSGMFSLPRKAVAVSGGEVKSFAVDPADCGWGETLPDYPKPGLWLARFGEMGKRIWTCHADHVDGSAAQELHGMRLIRWIPVTERLPGLKMRVQQAHHAEWLGTLNSSIGFLVTIGHHTHSVFRVLNYNTGEEFWAWDTDGSDRVCDGLITYWAEFPAPPIENHLARS